MGEFEFAARQGALQSEERLVLAGGAFRPRFFHELLSEGADTAGASAAWCWAISSTAPAKATLVARPMDTAMIREAAKSVTMERGFESLLISTPELATA
jgi:cyanophycinase-like exopeptidase